MVKATRELHSLLLLVLVLISVVVVESTPKPNDKPKAKPRTKYPGWSIKVAQNLQHESDNCRLGIAESMPDGLELPSLPGGVKLEATHDALIDMIEKAKDTIRIASFYLELTPQDESYKNDASAKPGLAVREALKNAGLRNVDVEIIVDHTRPKFITNVEDIKYLEEVPTIRVKELNFKMVNLTGILHTKLMIVDNSSFYIGSANFDWRAYTQVKEIGLVGRECPNMANDLAKMYNTYELLTNKAGLPDLGLYPEFQTEFNIYTPVVSNNMNMFFTASPAPLNGLQHPTGRTNDDEALLRLIRNAKDHIDISVEYDSTKRYWSQIDLALREAAVKRGVQIRLMYSNRDKPLELAWYKYLKALQSKPVSSRRMHVKLFEVPKFGDFQKELSFARVKNDRYMVTDNSLYVSTNNWTPDDANNTAGISAVMTPNGEAPTMIIQTMRDVFERDFNSEFAHEVDEYLAV